MKTIVVLLFSVTSLCANVVYSYQGNKFNEVTGAGGPTVSDSIQVTFEIADPLPANLIGWNSQDIGTGSDIPLFSWTLSDGVRSFSSQQDNNIEIGVSTSSTGSIVAWEVQRFDQNYYLVTARPSYACCPGAVDQSATFGNGQFFAPTSIAKNENMQGQWTSISTNVPESSTWAFVAIPLAVLIGVRQTFRRGQPQRLWETGDRADERAHGSSAIMSRRILALAVVRAGNAIGCLAEIAGGTRMGTSTRPSLPHFDNPDVGQVTASSVP